MSNAFYRDVKVIKFCKVCKSEFRPPRNGVNVALGLCVTHRRRYFKKQINAWLKKIPEEQRAEYKKHVYATWLKWKEAHLLRRRAIALKSYHKLKKLKNKKIAI